MSSLPRGKKIRGVLVDLSGTLHIGNTLIAGAKEAIEKLRQDGGCRIRFLTNTSTKSSQALLEQLRQMGIDMEGKELMTSIMATKQYLIQHKLRPFCLLEDTSDWTSTGSDDDNGDDVVDMTPPHNCVVVGLAPSKLNYSTLNQAFRILMEENNNNNSTTTKNNNLIAIHRGRYLRDTDGQLSLGPGGFVTALETATGRSPDDTVVMGKPSPEFFTSALWEDIPLEETCMIGDSIDQDLQGAMNIGIGTTILVQTGKYQPGDEKSTLANQKAITKLCPSIVEAADYILEVNGDSLED